MSETKPGKATDRLPAAKGAGGKSKGFSQAERAAMRERARELKADASRASGEADLAAAIEKMQEPDRGIAKRVDQLIKAAAPELASRTWYGMPAYVKDGNVICFFQNAGKFGARYQTLGFNDKAHLDDGSMWPTAFAIRELSEREEARITALVQKAVS